MAEHTPSPCKQHGQFISDTTETMGGMWAVRGPDDRLIGAAYRREDAVLWAAAPDLEAQLQNFVNGVETGAITSDHDEVLENVTRRAREILTYIKGGA